MRVDVEEVRVLGQLAPELLVPRLDHGARSLERGHDRSASQTRGGVIGSSQRRVAGGGCDGVRDRGGRADDGRLADALRAERPVRSRHLDDERLDLGDALGASGSRSRGTSP